MAPVLTAALLVPLVRPTWLWFLHELPSERWADPLAGAEYRLSLLLLGWVSLDVYGVVVRGRDRPVLEIHPVDPAGVVLAELAALTRDRWWVPLVIAAVLAPVAVNGWAMGYGLAVLVLCGSWALGMVASAMVYLFAAEAAQSPRWAGVLDLVRGTNPRQQAAFIWAPGVVLAGCSAVAWLATVGVVRAVSGEVVWGGVAALPLLIAPVVALPVPRLARRRWFQASTVLDEITARYATIEDPMEALRVYLEWAIRFLPRRVGLFALKDLRHGWRHRRTWISATWLVGLAAYGAGWSEMTYGPARAAVVSSAGVWLCASVGVLMRFDEPRFMSMQVDVGGPERLLARLWAVAGWMQCCVGPAALAVAIRRGIGDALFVVAVAEANVVAAALFGWFVSRLGRGGMKGYGLVGVLVSAAMAMVLMAGGVG